VVPSQLLSASKIQRARDMPKGTTLAFAVSILGNGVQLSAQDPVPFALWCASRHLDSVEETLPTRWLRARETFPEQFSAS